MTFPLADLPKEIIDQILSFKGLSPSVLLLWMTGDPCIHRSLATGLTSIELVNKQEFVFCRFPKILQNLRALRDLCVDRNSYGIPCMSGVRETIRNLSPTLRSIEIRVLGAGRFFATSSAQDVISSSNGAESSYTGSPTTPLWTVKSAFPLLESLIVDYKFAFNASDLLDLPEGLTTLHTRLSGYDDDLLSIETSVKDIKAVRRAFVRNLPRSLTHLGSEEVGICVSDYEHLPPLLTLFFNVSECNDPDSMSAKHIAKLPRSLTAEYDTLPNRPTLKQLAAYPPNLCSVRLIGLESDSEDGMVGSDLDIDAMFPKLEVIRAGYFGIIVTPKTLLSMPLTLVSMDVRLNLEDIKASDWPRSLTELAIDPIVYPPRFDALPRDTLKHLSVGPTDTRSSLGTASFALLPRSLLSLSCRCENLTSDVDFPPNLTKLTLEQGQQSMTVVEHEDFFETEFPYEDEYGVMEASTRIEPFDIDRESHLPHLKSRPKLVKCLPFEKIPASVQTLIIQCSIPASKLKSLPRHLTSLSARAIFEDEEFDPSSASEVEALREIREADDAGDVSSKDYLSLSSDNTAAMVARLPRNINFMCISIVAFDKKASNDWYRAIPSRIETLILSGSVEGEFVHQAPLQHIKSLAITLRQPKDEDIKALPRKSTSIEIIDGSLLTHMAAAYWPHIASPWSDYFQSTEWLSRLWKKRRDHAGNEDPTELRKLYGTDPKDFEFLTQPHHEDDAE